MNTYKRYRFLPDIISYTVWRYYRFNLSHRDIEDLLAEKRSGYGVSNRPGGMELRQSVSSSGYSEVMEVIRGRSSPINFRAIVSLIEN